jgi:hypothetical protein
MYLGLSEYYVQLKLGFFFLHALTLEGSPLPDGFTAMLGSLGEYDGPSTPLVNYRPFRFSFLEL